MRVLTVSWEYPPHIVGGMGRHVAELTHALAGQQVEMHVLTPLLHGGAAYEQTPEGVHIHRVAPPPNRADDLVGFAQQMNDRLEQEAHRLFPYDGTLDLIHVHDWSCAAAAMALKHAWGLPLVATIHATERGRGQGHLNNGHAERIDGIEWQLTYEARRVITCSRFMAEQVHDYFKTAADKIDVVPNGVPIIPDPFVSGTERQVFRRQWAADHQPLAFYVGRMVYEKGVHVLLAAWRKVQAAQPEARLVIAGTGGYLDTLKAQAAEAGLDGSVVFTGYIPDDMRDRLYHVADVAVFPSLYEPFGIVALEAMAAGCPVVVTNTGGLAEVVRPHETGIAAQPGNADSLAWGILHTLEHPEWSHARAGNALHSVRAAFNWQRAASLTVEIYTRTYAAWQAGGWGRAAA